MAVKVLNGKGKVTGSVQYFIGKLGGNLKAQQVDIFVLIKNVQFCKKREKPRCPIQTCFADHGPGQCLIFAIFVKKIITL